MTDSVTTGALLCGKAVEAVLYYGGRVCGICAVFSAVNRQRGWMSDQFLRFLICRIIKDMQPKTARCAGRGRNWMELSIHSVL